MNMMLLLLLIFLIFFSFDVGDDSRLSSFKKKEYDANQPIISKDTLKIIG